MELEAFRKRIRELYRPTGFSQKMLARALDLQPTALSNKLNGTGETSLKHTEVKQIIKILADWEAIDTQAQAIELLELMNLKQSSFTLEEWNSAPLNKLTLDLLTSKPSLIPEPPVVSRVGKITKKEDSLTSTPSGLEPPLRVDEARKEIEPHLPTMLTPLIGRESVMRQVLDLIRQDEVRLVTLSGSGGVGKTRLALQLATRLKGNFKDGVFFISLAFITDPTLVLSTIALTIGVRESGAQPLNSLLKEYLADKQLLLILDNFEQVLDAAVKIKDLMVEITGLKLLITSRALLRIYGEYEFIVPPLELPDLAQLQGELLSLEELADYESIKLFIQRAQAAQAGFKLTQVNALVIAKICRRLDGLPLALELAAARTKILSLDQILDRLEHRLELLNRGPQDLPVRQQTLRGLIDWSYDLLEQEEKELFACLSVFVGGCNLAAIEAVCTTGETDETGLLNTLSDLLDKSMLELTQSESKEIRYGMLDTLREYAREKLKLAGETSILEERHFQYFLGIAEQAEIAFGGGQQKLWLDRLETEHANLRAALLWAIEEKQIELALRLSSSLAWFWDAHGHLSEGRRWLELSLSLSERGSQISEAENKQEGSVSGSLSRLRAKALNAAGNLARKQGDIERATFLLEESLLLRKKSCEIREIAQTLNNLGVVAYHQGNLERAQEYYEESIALKYQLGDKRSIGLSLNNLAELVKERGEVEQAISLFQQSLALLRETGDLQNVAAVLLNLGVATVAMGDLPQASMLLTESLQLLGELGDRFHLAETLESLASLAIKQERVEQAVKLFGAAYGLRQAIGSQIESGGKAHIRYQQDYESAKAQLSPAQWKHYFQAGQEMKLSEVISYALAEFRN